MLAMFCDGSVAVAAAVLLGPSSSAAAISGAFSSTSIRRLLEEGFSVADVSSAALTEAARRQRRLHPRNRRCFSRSQHVRTICERSMENGRTGVKLEVNDMDNAPGRCDDRGYKLPLCIGLRSDEQNVAAAIFLTSIFARRLCCSRTMSSHIFCRCSGSAAVVEMVLAVSS